MPYQTHLKMTFLGSFLGASGAVVEEFVFGINYGFAASGSGPLIDPLTQSEVNAIAASATIQTAVTTFWTSNDSHLTANVRLDECKFACIDTTGHYLGDAAYMPINAVGHSAAGDSFPSTTAVVVSLRGTGRGPKNRGRFFIPGFTGGITNWEWDPGYFDPLATNVGTLLAAIPEAMNTAIGGGYEVALVVASKVAGNVPVVTTELNSLPGNISRRKNKLKSTYQSD